VTAGEIGYPYLLRALEQSGHDGLILAMLLRRDPPSYGSQLEAGATSLTEAWDANPHNSQDHFMLGSADSWFYRRLGGIDIDMSRSDAAARVTVRPIALPGIDWVKTSYDACIGSIQSSWTWDGSVVRYSVRIPGGVESTVVLPASAVAVDARVHQSESQAGDAVFRVGPGSWEFIVRP
jgi:hypothetical protein